MSDDLLYFYSPCFLFFQRLIFFSLLLLFLLQSLAFFILLIRTTLPATANVPFDEPVTALFLTSTWNESDSSIFEKISRHLNATPQAFLAKHIAHQSFYPLPYSTTACGNYALIKNRLHFFPRQTLIQPVGILLHHILPRSFTRLRMVTIDNIWQILLQFGDYATAVFKGKIHITTDISPSGSLVL